ncbi:acetyltransferase (GNAT) family protein [Bacillus oleivorans]|uniref:Acetyltransferase (GNAT) family protein n=1 Tax=Bacillus oleivorans TaxID=1448271 RepID=A0A285CYI1_9BACI|nr:GNAT family N-acetyltransferase [Bacillus oleivorans]SNX72465.1 acetyltransferase (GNAT) family protein [Bacillus oleivorans]
MEVFPLYMLHNLNKIPVFPLPEGFHFRFFQDSTDDINWARITAATGEFNNEQDALNRFNLEFRTNLNEAQKRILFLETTAGQTVGTATAWFGVWSNEIIGRLHWIEIIPEFQGKKLGKPLITEAMNILARYHEKAYLKTQTTSLAAIHLYKKLGWEPAILTKEDQLAWDQLNNPM